MAQTTEQPTKSTPPSPGSANGSSLAGKIRSRFPALRSRNFRVLWLGLIFSNAGAQMQMVAESWLIIQLTNSPLALGIMSMAWGIPMVVLPMFGGVIADRFDRLTVLKFTQTEEVVVPLILGILIATGHLHVWILYVEAAIGGSTLAFDNPARQAILPGLVEPDELMNATALNSAVWTGAMLVGPALGGVLLSLVGAAWLFIINGVTTSAVLYAIFTMRDVRNRNESRPEPMLERLIGGVRFTLSNRGVMALMIITAATGILGRSYSTLLPVFAKDLWHTGPSGYGLLLAAPGLGALIGAFGTAALGDIDQKGRFVIVANVVYCGALFAFALLPPFLGGMALLAVAGLASTAFGAAIGTMLLFATPGPLRGRVMSLYAIMVMGAPSLGGFLGGAVAESTSAQLAVGGGVLLLGIVTLLLVRPVTRPMPEALETA